MIIIFFLFFHLNGCFTVIYYNINRILMFEEKNKEKPRPTGLPPKKSLADLPWGSRNVRKSERQVLYCECVQMWRRSDIIMIKWCKRKWMIYVILLFCFIMSLLNLIQVRRYGSSLLIKWHYSVIVQKW